MRVRHLALFLSALLPFVGGTTAGADARTVWSRSSRTSSTQRRRRTWKVSSRSGECRADPHPASASRSWSLLRP